MAQPDYSDFYKRHRVKERGHYLPDITYRVRADGSKAFYYAHKGKHVGPFKTLTEVKVAQAEVKSKHLRGEPVVLPSKKTFREVAEEWYAAKTRRLRPATASYYRQALDLVLLPRFGDVLVSNIWVEDITQLIHDLEDEGLHAVDRSRAKRGLSRSSIDNYLKPLQGTLKFALRRRMIASNPWGLLDGDDRPDAVVNQAHVWSDTELSSVFQAAEELAAKKESRADYTLLLRVAATLGLRCGEILGLRWEDLDKENSELHVRRQLLRTGEYGDPKTKAGKRDIPLPADLREALLAHRLASRFSQDDQPIFASRSGTPFGHRNVTRRGWEAVRDKAGLDKSLTFHDLRHAAASRLIAARLTPVQVAHVLGHKDPAVTLKVYAHLFDQKQSNEAVRQALAGVGAQS
jgi:integrase